MQAPPPALVRDGRIEQTGLKTKPETTGQPPHAAQGPDGKWNTYAGDKMAWDPSAICSNNPQFGGHGNPKQGDDFSAAPNIDHSQVICPLSFIHHAVAFF